MPYIELEPEQEEFFRELVEAERRIPRAQRDHFLVRKPAGRQAGVQLAHPGWVDSGRRIFEGDIEALARAGLIAISYTHGLQAFYVTPEGFAYHAQMMRRRGEPLQRVQLSVREYVESAAFQSRYRSAYAKWAEAENLLWSDDTEKALTTIGHLLREAMQEFATALVERFRPPSLETDKAKTVSRIRAVLGTRKLGDKVNAFLDALLTYWGTVSDLVQRQEHGAARNTEPLKWVDARRVVFQVAIVMLEIDAAVTST